MKRRVSLAISLCLILGITLPCAQKLSVIATETEAVSEADGETVSEAAVDADLSDDSETGTEKDAETEAETVPETEAESETETETETESETEDSVVGELVFAQCEDYINIREEADTEAEITAKIYNNGSATVVSVEGDWYEITSGNAQGYAKTEYFATGEEAEAIAEKVAYNVATVNAEYLNIRAEASTESEVIDVAKKNDQIEVVQYGEEWMKVALGNDIYGYLMSEYVDYATYYPVAETLEEEQARLIEEGLLEEASAAAAESTPAETAETEAAAAESGEAVETDAAAAVQAETVQAEAVGTVQTEAAQTETAMQTEAAQTEASTQAETVQTEASVQTESVQAETSVQTEATQAETSAQTEAETSSAQTETTQTEAVQTETAAQTETAQTETAAAQTETEQTEAAVQTEAEQTETSAQTEAETEASSSSSSSSTGESIAAYALQFVGNPYVYGGTSLTSGADCSGFVQSVFAHFGIYLSRTAAAQSTNGTSISLSELQAGDLLFYSSSGDGSIDHVAIYIGGGMIVHAANSTRGICTDNAYYTTPVCAVRCY